MKNFFVFFWVMMMSVAVSGSVIPVLNIDTSVPGHCEVVFFQGSPNPTGSGGEMTVLFDGNVSGIRVDNLTPIPNYAEEEFYGFGWGFEGCCRVLNGQIQVGKIATAGVGTPGLGTDMNAVLPEVQDYIGTFGFGFDYEGTVDIEFSGIWDGWDTSGLNFTVPEPMTMSLLGFGGLVAVRRRR